MNRVTVVLILLHVSAAHGEPPVPLRVTNGLFDQDIPSLGLEPMKGEHSTLYRATESNYRFCHHANFVVFNDQLYVMWSNGKEIEDGNGQRILWSQTRDGRTWTSPEVLVEDFDGAGPLACVAAGFRVSSEGLTAYFTAIVGEDPLNPQSAVYAQSSKDGKSWSKPRKVTTGFFIEGPRKTAAGVTFFNGQTHDRQPKLLWAKGDAVALDWQDAHVPAAGIFTFPEPTWYARPDGSLVMVFRTKSGHFHLYASESRDGGRTWSTPVETNFPDATARSFAGNLPDGTVFLINNPTQKSADFPNIGRRIPLAIAFSRDGRAFERAAAVRGEPTQLRFPGKNKVAGWQYPSAVAWRDHFYIAYSINKEDVGVTRYRLEQLVDDARSTTRRDPIKSLRDIGATVFERRGKVVEVNANRTPIKDDHLELIGQMTRLTDLSLEMTSIGDAGLQHVRRLPRLEWLNLYRTRVSDAGLEALTTLPRLQHLPIGETRITDAGMATIGKLRSLQYLGLRGNPITDDGVRKIGGLQGLKSLYLGETKVTDACLTTVERLARLEQLWLNKTAISDAGIASLAKMKTLKTVDLSGTQVGRMALLRLTDALPQCRIVTDVKLDKERW